MKEGWKVSEVKKNSIGQMVKDSNENMAHEYSIIKGILTLQGEGMKLA